MVEGEWGEGKGVKFQDEDGDWVNMRTNDDVVEVWNETKKGVVSLEVFSTQQNQVFFVCCCCLFVSFVCVTLCAYALTICI